MLSGIIIEKEQETEEQKIDRLIKVIYSKIVNSSIPSSDVISELRVAFIYADTFAISKFCKRLVEYQSKLKSKENMQELEMLCRILYLEERNKSAKDPKLADGDLAGWLRFYLNLQQMHYQLTTKKNKSISLNEVFSQIDCLETANAIQCQWFIDKIAHGWPENLFAEVLNRYRQRYAMSRTSSVFYAYLEWEKLTRVLKKARNQADMVADIPYFNQVLTGLPEKEREVFLRRIHTVSSIEQRQWLVWAMFQCEVESFMHNPQMFLENSLVKPVTESCLRQALFSSAAESDFRMALPLDTEGLRYFVPAFTSNNPERRFSALGLRREEVVNILQNRKHDLEARKLISQEIYVTFSGEEFQDEVLEFKILRAALATHQRALEVLCESIIKYYYGNLNRVTPDNPEKIKHLLGSKKNDRKAQSWLTEIKQCEHQINNSKEVIAQAIVSVDFYERYLELIGRNANLGYFTALLCTQSLKNRSLIVAELVKNPEEPLKMVVRHIEPNKPIMFWAVVNRNNPFDFELILEETTPSSLLRLFLQADYNIRGFGQWLVSKGFPHTPNWKIVGTCLEEIAKGLIKFTPQFREEDQAYVLAIKIFLGWFNFQFQENIQILYNHLFVRNGNMEARLQYYSRIMSRIVTDEYLPAYFLQQFRFDATAASRRRESLTISDFITQAVRDEFKLFCQRAAIYAVEHNQVNLLKALVPPKQEIIFCYQQKFRLHREIETIEIQQAIVEGYYEILQKINSKSDPIIYLDVLKDQLRQKEIEIEQKLLTAFDPKNNANKGWLRRELLPGEEIPNEWKIEAKHNYAEKIKSEMMRYRLSEARILGVLMSKDELTLCLQELENIELDAAANKKLLKNVCVPDADKIQKEWQHKMLEYFLAHLLYNTSSMSNEEKEAMEGLLPLRGTLPLVYKNVLRVFENYNEPYLWLRQLEEFGYTWNDQIRFHMSEKWQQELAVDDNRARRAIINRHAHLFFCAVWPDFWHRVFSLAAPNIDVNFFIDANQNTLAHKAAQMHDSASIEQDRTAIYNVLIQLGIDPNIMNAQSEQAKMIFFAKGVNVSTLYANAWSDFQAHLAKQEGTNLSTAALVNAHERLFFDPDYKVGVLTQTAEMARLEEEQALIPVSPTQTFAHKDIVLTFIPKLYKFLRLVQVAAEYWHEEDQKTFQCLPAYFYKSNLTSLTPIVEALQAACKRAVGVTGYDTESVAKVAKIYEELVKIQKASVEIKTGKWQQRLKELIKIARNICDKFKKIGYGRDIARTEPGELEIAWRNDLQRAVMSMDRTRADALAVSRQREREQEEENQRLREEAERERQQYARERAELNRQKEELEARRKADIEEARAREATQAREAQRLQAERAARQLQVERETRQLQTEREARQLQAEREEIRIREAMQYGIEMKKQLAAQAALYEARIREMERKMQAQLSQPGQYQLKPSTLTGRTWVVEEDVAVLEEQVRVSLSRVSINNNDFTDLPAPGVLGTFPPVREQSETTIQRIESTSVSKPSPQTGPTVGQ